MTIYSKAYSRPIYIISNLYNYLVPIAILYNHDNRLALFFQSI